MKLLVTSFILFCSFLVSNAQPTERELKELLVSYYEQNGQLTYKLTLKDSIISEQDSLIAGKIVQINSYKRDSIAFGEQTTAYKKGIMVCDSTVNSQDKTIRKQKVQNLTLKGSLGLSILIIILLAI